MLGTYPPKSSSATNSKPAVKTTKTRSTTAKENEAGPKTRSASTRREKEAPITITYLGRAARASSDSDIAASSSASATRSRRPPAAVKRATVEVIPSNNSKDNLSSSSNSSADSSLRSSGWAACIAATNQIGVIAKRENKNIRRLNELRIRRPNTYEKSVAHDEELTLTAVRILTNRNTWSLSTCHAYLPIIIENITSDNQRNRSTALDGLEVIAGTWLERIMQFGRENTRGIGVDVAAEERFEKANNCIKQFREMVQKRDVFYKRMDEESVYKLDNIFARLKQA